MVVEVFTVVTWEFTNGDRCTKTQFIFYHAYVKSKRQYTEKEPPETAKQRTVKISCHYQGSFKYFET